MTKPHINCAVYTRKSSEEGLEQSFNSLEAQWEACAAYIESQKHEGWVLVEDHYDDGGFSGGSMDRPALRRLLDDISAGKVQTVIVYKVDRLTRSLADFAKIIEVFDSKNASFVSVTQQFNTTTSMGRLTLNVLLSFAQFERELTGERIRDKVAASKKKGMWMGGVVPMGYDCSNHRLIVNEAEAKIVREVFRQYLRLGCVSKLRDYLRHGKIRSKVRTSQSGQASGGVTYSRGALYHLLNNRTYIGQIVHRDQCYAGQHKAIIEQELWDQVAARLKANNQAHRTGKSTSTSSLLTGMVFDAKGVRFTPTHAVKSGKRYRYYTSQATIQTKARGPSVSRIPAQELETLVLSQIQLLLQFPDKCTNHLDNTPEKSEVTERVVDLAKRWLAFDTSKQQVFVRQVLRRVIVGQKTVWIEVDSVKLVRTLLERKPESATVFEHRGPNVIKLIADFEAVRQRNELRLVTPTDSPSDGIPIPSLAKAVARARDWYERIVAREVDSVGQLAEKMGLSSTYVKRILGCAILSPLIIETVLLGSHQPNLQLQEIVRDVPINWRTQQDRIFQAP